MGRILIKIHDIKKNVQFIFFVFFFIGVTTLVKIPNLNKIYKVLLVALIFEGLILNVQMKRLPKLHPVFFLSVFALVCLASAAWSYKVQVDTIIVVFMVTLACSALYFIIDSEETLDLVLYAILIAVIVEFFYNIYQLGAVSILSKRMALQGFNSNQVGVEIAYSSNICLYFWTKLKQKRFVLIYLVLAMFCFLTGSRTALILFFTGGLVFFLHLGNKKNVLRKRIFLCSIAVIVMIFLLVKVEAFYNIIGRRLIEDTIVPFFRTLMGEDSSSVTRKGSNYYRWKMIEYGVDFFVKKPILGLGINNYKVLIAETSLGTTSYAHNNYIELLADVGMIGFAVYYFPFLLSGITILKRKKNKFPIFQMATSLWFCLLIDDLTGVYYYVIFQRLIFMLIMVILYKSEFLSKKHEDTNDAKNMRQNLKNVYQKREACQNGKNAKSIISRL